MIRRPPRSPLFPYTTLSRPRQIRSELAGAAGPARWASLADMIHLVDEPLVREAFFPSTVQHYAVEPARDRKSTRLNSSHANISYAVFCLKKKSPHYGDRGGA